MCVCLSVCLLLSLSLPLSRARTHLLSDLLTHALTQRERDRQTETERQRDRQTELINSYAVPPVPSAEACDLFLPLKLARTGPTGKHLRWSLPVFLATGYHPGIAATQACLSFSLSLSLSHIRTHSLTHAHTHTHTHGDTGGARLKEASCGVTHTAALTQAGRCYLWGAGVLCWQGGGVLCAGPEV